MTHAISSNQCKSVLGNTNVLRIFAFIDLKEKRRHTGEVSGNQLSINAPFGKIKAKYAIVLCLEDLPDELPLKFLVNWTASIIWNYPSKFGFFCARNLAVFAPSCNNVASGIPFFCCFCRVHANHLNHGINPANSSHMCLCRKEDGLFQVLVRYPRQLLSSIEGSIDSINRRSTGIFSICWQADIQRHSQNKGNACTQDDLSDRSYRPHQYHPKIKVSKSTQ